MVPRLSSATPSTIAESPLGLEEPPPASSKNNNGCVCVCLREACLQRPQLDSPVPSSIPSLCMWVGRAPSSCLPLESQELLLWSL